MGEVQFYYSAGGREVYGPVTKTMLHQLLRDHIVDSTYFFCREGEAEWRPLDPAVLAAEPEALESEAVAPESGGSPPTETEERYESFWSTWVEIMESTSIRLFLYCICILIPLLVGFILTSHYARTLPWTDQSESHIGPLTGHFTGVVVIVALLVFLTGLPFSKAYRLWVRTCAMLFLGALVAVGLIH